ncbi:hypothetical protein CEXT_602851 [Caerostris extrusa]|uniref:Uncharacterized protein n=1 Tax=Caerostris extrusa TaxID=172846 RepID=A0AAV4R4S1_CAEEX|nr:hypothetical protein CEXT_602851 [Caerostris extrusa]
MIPFSKFKDFRPSYDSTNNLSPFECRDCLDGDERFHSELCVCSLLLRVWCRLSLALIPAFVERTLRRCLFSIHSLCLPRLVAAPPLNRVYVRCFIRWASFSNEPVGQLSLLLIVYNRQNVSNFF